MASVAAGAVLLVAYVLHAALPASPLHLPGPDTTTVRDLVPQGWAFFTKSPRGKDALVYRHDDDGTWHDLGPGPLAQPKHLMGLDRAPRAQGTEVALLLARVSPDAWRDCDRAPSACLSEATAATTVANGSNLRTVCGDVGLVTQAAVPWAWRDLATTMPSRVARVRVTC
ncbi:SdpA family antimicrobial peptide system protein [Longispora fulva]|uniref:Antimicrobial peptide system SdpA family protein n=1 Tax=Longispora fulva TaxID=619741 RepID=A0A8J7GJ77_9ACTN|nr:SdpA family antimicrobial peptide system protein [Longispora fulva]MBG6137752.1 antimicrobial peptide system SdpA family protein [Longispora fulva]